MNSPDDLYDYLLNNSSSPFYLENININNLDNIIYLTENGFSEPVGVYDIKNKTAKLTKSIVDKELVITIGDITFNGNNHSIKNNSLDVCILIKEGLKNISIENLYLNSSNIDVYVEPYCENIKFRNSIFKGKNIGINFFVSKNIFIESSNFYLNDTGILLIGCKDLIIKSNKFISNDKGIYFFKNNSNCNIIDNLFSDCVEGISMYLKNSFNIIDSNKFQNENNVIKQYFISISDNNSYNKISKNLMIFSNKTITYDIGSISSEFIAIYIYGDINISNTISKNKIIFKNNKLNFNNTSPIILLSGIYSCGNNSDLEISYNQIDIMNNELSISKGISPYLSLNNIYLSKHSKCIIKNNFLRVSNNQSNLKSNNSYFEISNLKLDKYNKSIKILYNEFDINQNKSINISSSLNIFNISLINNNSDLDIKDNLFKINNNSYGYITSINLYNKNYNNKISYNKFTSIDGISIILDIENTSNVIVYNDISCNNFTILLNEENTSNIIKENTLSTLASSNLLLIFNNSNNLISENYIENNLFGIFILNNTNNFNSIISNEFYKTSQDISTPSNSYNYIYDNKNYCLEYNTTT